METNVENMIFEKIMKVETTEQKVNLVLTVEEFAVLSSLTFWFLGGIDQLRISIEDGIDKAIAALSDENKEKIQACREINRNSEFLYAEDVADAIAKVSVA